MKATEILKREHQAILRVIDAAEKEVAFIEKTGGTHAQTVREMADFFGNFRVESEEMGEGVHERYHAWIEKRVGAQAGARQDRTGVPVK